MKGGREWRKGNFSPLRSPPLPLLPLFSGGKGGGSHSNFHAMTRVQTLDDAGLSLSELYQVHLANPALCVISSQINVRF